MISKEETTTCPVDNLSSLLDTRTTVRLLSVDERDGDNTLWAGYLSGQKEGTASLDAG